MSLTFSCLVGKNKKKIKNKNTNNLKNLDREKKIKQKQIWEFRVKFQEEDEYIRQWGENK